MSGTLVISESNVWMPASWAYNATLTGIATELEASWPALAEELRRATHSFGYLTLETWSAEPMSALLAAARRALDNFIREGPASFALPKFQPAFIDCVRGLIVLLEKEPRCSGA
jgi:hypothetical protein